MRKGVALKCDASLDLAHGNKIAICPTNKATSDGKKGAVELTAHGVSDTRCSKPDKELTETPE